MKWLYQNINSVFFTILVATVLLKLLTLVSDIKTRKSSAKMAAIQPEINKIQKKYKDDPRKAQAEQSKLMKERGVSMWGSCLPMLITMPLFFCFIAAFRFWSYEEMIRILVDDNPQKLLESFKFLWVNNIWQPDNGLSPVIMDAATFLNTKDLGNLLYVQQNTQIWDKLVDMGIAMKQSMPVVENGVTTMKDTLIFLNTPEAIASYTAAVKPLMDIYAGHNNGWFILPLLAAGTNLLSMLMTQKNQPQSAPAGGSGKLMMYMFPAMSFFVCLTATSAFAIYWTISSVLMIVINLILNKVYPREPLAQEVKK
ncbi:MAG: YidC/Oxa1 family membrane protein insertase [Clostridia bacterium]